MSDSVDDTLKNPSVIIEVSSPSSLNYDIGAKLIFYMQIATLKEYIIIDSTKRFIRIARRNSEGLRKFEEFAEEGDQVFINAINYHLKLDDVYKKEKL